MKSFILFLFSAIIFSSCTTAFKTGQTPDDVYYSPDRPQEEYVRTETREKKYHYDEEYNDDRYLRMKVRNRQMWSDLDYYYNDPFAYRYDNNYYSYNRGYNNPWNNYSSWNYFHNPYAPRVYLYPGTLTPRTTYNRPRTFNLNTFNNPLPPNNNANPKTLNTRGIRVLSSNNTNSSGNNQDRRDAGSTLRDVFNNSNSSSSPSIRTQSSSSNNSSSNSSGSTSRPASSGGSAPVRKF